MKSEQVKAISRLSAEIQNFEDCYSDIKLSGSSDGYVPSECIIEWLTENSHMAKLALSIAKMENDINNERFPVR